MRPTELGMHIGELRAGIRSVNSRVDDLREVVMHLLRERKAGHSKGIPWIQIAAYGATAIFSLLGITVPEKVAAVLRALMH